MDSVVVAVHQQIADAIDVSGVEIVAWDGTGSEPREDITLWVPRYQVGRSAADIRLALASMPQLRAVQLLTAGVEPWPELVAASVTLCAGKTIHGGSTAELAVALTLALVRDLPTYAAQQGRREWTRHAPASLADRSVMVLGAGDIGARVAATFRTLDAAVTLVARSRETTVEQAFAQLGRTDVLVIALPLTDQTRGLVDASWLAALPDGAIVVNVARGALIDQTALTAEVASGRLRAGLDVTDPEPLPADHALWTLPGVIITPHVGGGAQGWHERAVRLVNDQVRRLRDGEPLRYVVEAGY